MAELSSEMLALANEWDLSVTDELPQGRMSEVTAVRTSSGEDAVLKLVHPNTAPSAIVNEMAALEALQVGGVSVRVLKFDVEKRAMLLERLNPGTPLSSLCPHRDEEATSIGASLIVKAFVPIPAEHHFRSTSDILDELRTAIRVDSPLPTKLLRRCVDVMTELVDTEEERFVVHGDLHHNNILQASKNRWVAIDPDPVIAEPAYIAASFLRNPYAIFFDLEDTDSFQQRRLAQMVEATGFDRDRLQGWAFSRTGLSLANMWINKQVVYTPWLKSVEAFQPRSRGVTLDR